MGLLRKAAKVITVQKLKIREKDAEIAELHRMVLSAQRSNLELAIWFRVLMDRPEIDAHEDLDLLIDALASSVSQLEEFVV